MPKEQRGFFPAEAPDNKWVVSEIESSKNTAELKSGEDLKSVYQLQSDSSLTFRTRNLSGKGIGSAYLAGEEEARLRESGGLPHIIHAPGTLRSSLSRPKTIEMNTMGVL